MKTVSGKVVNTVPISLSKAAKVISNFASFDNGASDAVSIYLRRTSEAFDALVQFHKDLKAHQSHSSRRPKSRLIENILHSTDSQIDEEKSKNENFEDIVKERKKKRNMKERLVVEDGKNNDQKKRKRGEVGVDSTEKKSKRIKVEG